MLRQTFLMHADSSANPAATSSAPLWPGRTFLVASAGGMNKSAPKADVSREHPRTWPAPPPVRADPGRT